MDRRIKAILVANNIYDLSSIELRDYQDGILEIVKSGEIHYLTLGGEVSTEEVEDLEEIVPEVQEIKEEPITEIIENVDELFEEDEKVEDVDFDVDLDDDFNFEDEVKSAEIPSQDEKIKTIIEETKNSPIEVKVTEKIIIKNKEEKPKRTHKKKKIESSDDDFINLL